MAEVIKVSYRDKNIMHRWSMAKAQMETVATNKVMEARTQNLH